MSRVKVGVGVGEGGGVVMAVLQRHPPLEDHGAIFPADALNDPQTLLTRG